MSDDPRARTLRESATVTTMLDLGALAWLSQSSSLLTLTADDSLALDVESAERIN